VHARAVIVIFVMTITSASRPRSYVPSFDNEPTGKPMEMTMTILSTFRRPTEALAGVKTTHLLLIAAFTAVGLGLTFLTFAFGFGVEVGQVLGYAG
jgi:hypothetical protein